MAAAPEVGAVSVQVAAVAVPDLVTEKLGLQAPGGVASAPVVVAQ
jgi:hypothetical protein